MKREGTWAVPPWMRMSIPKAIMVYGGICGSIATIIIGSAFPYVLEPGNIRVWYLPAFVTAAMVLGGLGTSYIDLELTVRTNELRISDRRWHTTGTLPGAIDPEGQRFSEDEWGTGNQEQRLPAMDFCPVGGVRFLAEYGKGSDGVVVGHGPLGWASRNATNSGSDFTSPYQYKFIHHDEIAGKYISALANQEWFEKERPDGTGGSPIWLKLGLDPGFIDFLGKAGDVQAATITILGVHRIAREWMTDILDELEEGPKGQRLRELLVELRGPTTQAKVVEELMKRFDSARVSRAFYGLTQSRPAYYDVTAAKLQITGLEKRMRYLTAENTALWTTGRSRGQMVKEMTQKQLAVWSDDRPGSNEAYAENPRIPERQG